MGFFAMTGLACAVFILLRSTLPETRQHVPAAGNTLRRMTSDFNHLIRSRLFWGYTLVYGFINAAFFTFVTSAPLYFEEHLFTGPALFGVYMGSLAFTYIIGALIGSRIIRLHGSERALKIGLAGTFAGACLILFANWYFPPSVLTIISPFMLLFAFAGLVNPPSMAGAVAHHPDKAGTASGFSNSMSMAIGALSAVIASLVYNGGITSVCLPVVIAVTLSVATYLLLVSGNREQLA